MSLMHMPQANSLVVKYNVPCPRYTSYPTVPYWEQETFSREVWLENVSNTFSVVNKKEGISLYIHLPYCESLCTYCGCNTRITINHAVELPYIESVLHEWRLYKELFSETPILSELHLGGGTPTFFKPENLDYLITRIQQDCIIPAHAAYSFEGHPNNTTKEHLTMFRNLGFSRVSFGIQDFDEKVQRVINRMQPLENVVRATNEARELKYDSVNFDLVYGLPFQTLAGIIDTIEKVIALKPDRIAYYSYAHVPWVKPGQRMFSEVDLPDNDAKRLLYDTGKAMLQAAGYIDIGMDHFALANDELNIAAAEGKLHRNFMGYTAQYTSLSIGLGVSSISDSWGAFAQNVKTVEGYQKIVAQDLIPVFKGHVLTEEDKQIRTHILSIMCKGFTTFFKDELDESIMDRLHLLHDDALITLTDSKLTVTKIGKPFLRNICMAFDLRYWNGVGEKAQFSKSV
jgi:oxygen-independent coproporphyrinogen III oxidase